MTRPDPGAPGTRYGRRVVLTEATPAACGNRRVLVRCDCGRPDEVYLSSLARGRARQCRQCSGSYATELLVDRPGSRCGYRPQCPATGYVGCRYYLGKVDLCALTVADLGGVSATVVAELTGVTRQAVLAAIDRAGDSRRAALAAIQSEGFEHPHCRVPGAGR